MKMGEAAPCLVRSFSQPTSISCEFNQGDPLRALMTSISFGRFMTEPLDWEKWSTFSHNRTLEDVQKYSKPGSVAEKKAFFEAHYKKIAAKRAAKSPNENKENTTPKTNITHSATDDTQRNVSPAPSTNLVFSNINGKTSTEDVSAPSTNLVLSNTGNVDDNITSIGQVECEKTSTEDVSAPSTSLVLSNIGNCDENVPSVGEQEKMSTEDASAPRSNLVLSNMSSTHQVEQEKTSTEDVLLPRHVENDIQEQEERTQIKDKVSTEDVSAPSTNLVLLDTGNVDDNMPSTRQVEWEKTLSEDVLLPRHVVKDIQEQEEKIWIKTKPGISSRKYELRSPRKVENPCIRLTKAARDVMEKKRLAPQSLHMSMNFSPFSHKKGNSRTLGKTKDGLTGQQAETRVSGRPENRRSKTLLDYSVNGNRSVVVKLSLATKDSISSSACTKKPRSTTMVSSFSFRSQERAAKRKEFFQKLEEKGNTKETEKMQPQPKLKEKASNDHKKLRWSTALEAKPSTSETKLPSNSIQKVPPTQPHSPKLGKKPPPRPVQDTCYQPPWRSSIKPKNFVEMNKKKLSSSMACLPTKKMCENASPNIRP